MSIVELHEVKRHLHYADDSNDVSEVDQEI